jgi:hypothetical protein
VSVIDQAKEIAGLIKKIGDIELYRKIVALEDEIIELTKSKRELEIAKQGLETELALKKSMIFKAPLYFREGDSVPFCPHCWEKNNIAFHLAASPSQNPICYQCAACSARFDIINYVDGNSGWVMTEFPKK